MVCLQVQFCKWDFWHLFRASRGSSGKYHSDKSDRRTALPRFQVQKRWVCPPKTGGFPMNNRYYWMVIGYHHDYFQSQMQHHWLHPVMLTQRVRKMKIRTRERQTSVMRCHYHATITILCFSPWTCWKPSHNQDSSWDHFGFSWTFPLCSGRWWQVGIQPSVWGSSCCSFRLSCHWAQQNLGDVWTGWFVGWLVLIVAAWTI